MAPRRREALLRDAAAAAAGPSDGDLNAAFRDRRDQRDQGDQRDKRGGGGDHGGRSNRGGHGGGKGTRRGKSAKGGVHVVDQGDVANHEDGDSTMGQVSLVPSASLRATRAINIRAPASVRCHDHRGFGDWR